MQRLYGVGVGPGDPELLTIKGLRLIRSAPVVYVPVPAPGVASFARTIAAPYLDPVAQEVVELEYPVVRHAARLQHAWATNADIIANRMCGVEHAVFLTEGDPLLYSTFIHTYRTLRERHPGVVVEVVPGVTSVTASAAAAVRPLASGDERIAILPATRDPAALRQALRSFHTVVLLKVAPVLDAVLDTLEAEGLVERGVWVRRVSRPEQEIEHDLRRLRGRKLDYFSLVIVHTGMGGGDA